MGITRVNILRKRFAENPTLENVESDLGLFECLGWFLTRIESPGYKCGNGYRLELLQDKMGELGYFLSDLAELELGCDIAIGLGFALEITEFTPEGEEPDRGVIILTPEGRDWADEYPEAFERAYRTVYGHGPDDMGAALGTRHDDPKEDET